MRTVLKSSRIYTHDSKINGNIIMENGLIAGFNGEILPGDEVFDCGDMRVIPGIFDTHNHGTHGYNMMLIEEGSREEYVKKFIKGLAMQGVTSILPTCDVDMIGAAYKVSQLKDNDGADIVGIHSEGPWLNRVGEKGVKTGWPEVSLATAEKMVKDGGGKLCLVAIAPEIPGIDPIIEYFRSQGINLAFAHSDDTFEEAKAHLQGRYKVATHLSNVMTGLHHRDPGGLGACLLNDDMRYELICDGHHVHLSIIELFFRIQDYSKFMMVSDCSGLCGAPPGTYRGFDESMTLIMTDEGFVFTNTGRIMGSSQPVIYGIGNLVEKLHIPLETVLQMSSLNPAIVYGVADKKGSLKAGKNADVVVMDDNYKAVRTYVSGRKVFDVAVDGPLFNPEFFDIMKTLA